MYNHIQNLYSQWQLSMHTANIDNSNTEVCYNLLISLSIYGFETLWCNKTELFKLSCTSYLPNCEGHSTEQENFSWLKRHWSQTTGNKMLLSSSSASKGCTMICFSSVVTQLISQSNELFEYILENFSSRHGSLWSFIWGLWKTYHLNLLTLSFLFLTLGNMKLLNYNPLRAWEECIVESRNVILLKKSHPSEHISWYCI